MRGKLRIDDGDLDCNLENEWWKPVRDFVGDDVRFKAITDVEFSIGDLVMEIREEMWV